MNLLLKHLLVCCCISSLIVGCGGNVREGLSDEDQVSSTILAVGDVAADPESFATFFASGVAPDNGQEYATYLIELESEPQVSGSEATAQVKLTPGFADGSNEDGSNETESTTGTPVVVTWTLSKMGEEWKLESAPLN